MKGIGKLQTQKDLLHKLRHDFERLKQNPDDSYPAFDFFVTAEHMIDWELPGLSNKAARKQFRSSSPVLQAVSQIANSSKHQIADSTHHEHVQHVDAGPAPFPPGSWAPGVWAPGVWETGPLFITLQGEAKASLGAGILALDLATLVLKFWEDRVRSLDTLTDTPTDGNRRTR